MNHQNNNIIEEIPSHEVYADIVGINGAQINVKISSEPIVASSSTSNKNKNKNKNKNNNNNTVKLSTTTTTTTATACSGTETHLWHAIPQTRIPRRTRKRKQVERPPIFIIPKDSVNDHDDNVQQRNCKSSSSTPSSEFGEMYRRMSSSPWKKEWESSEPFSSSSDCTSRPTTSNMTAASATIRIYTNKMKGRTTILLHDHVSNARSFHLQEPSVQPYSQEKDQTNNSIKNKYEQEQRDMRRIRLMLRSDLSDEMISYLI